VQVFDATNTTRDRRRMIHSIVVEKMGYKLLFVESICNDPKIVQATIKEVKVNSPDYKDVENETVLNDFLLRIQHYEALYEPLDEILESHFSFMKVFNTGMNNSLNTSNIISRFIFIGFFRGQSVGASSRGSHSESSYLLSHEHSHSSAHNLSDSRKFKPMPIFGHLLNFIFLLSLFSAWRELSQPSREDRRRL
jgi:6-phosphofructo-2-kinase/fructose-2,6-biphosphatase 2